MKPGYLATAVLCAGIGFLAGREVYHQPWSYVELEDGAVLDGVTFHNVGGIEMHGNTVIDGVHMQANSIEVSEYGAEYADFYEEAVQPSAQCRKSCFTFVWHGGKP